MAAHSLVSVITIFKDAERFVREAIESVRSQTYPHWELLLVDDGSGDASTRIAREYADRYPRAIRYFEHEGHGNRGMSASRNLGIRQARGEYIGFLDGDDVYLPQKLERQVGILDARPEAAMVYGPSVCWYGWSGRAEDRQRDKVQNLGVAPHELIRPPALLVRYLAHQAWPPATCGVLVRRRSVESVGAFEEAFDGLFEDRIFFYKLCLHAPVFVDSEPGALYRQHPGSCCAMARSTGAYVSSRQPSAGREALLGALQRYMIEQGVVDPQLWQLMRRELRPYTHPRFARMLSRWDGARRRVRRYLR